MKLPLAQGVGKSGNEWKKQEYILETNDGQYPKKICFNLWGDRIDQFNIQEGEQLTVYIDIESREYNGRWYTDIRAWKVERGFTQEAPADAYAAAPNYAAAPAAAPAAQLPDFGAAAAPAAGVAGGSADDLPF